VTTARSYLASSGAQGIVSVASPREISVTVTITKPTTLLSLIGIGEVSATKTVKADLLQGVEAPRQ
jgi:hypothetical protein